MRVIRCHSGEGTIDWKSSSSLNQSQGGIITTDTNVNAAEVEQQIRENIKATLETKSSGSVKNTLQNCITVLYEDPGLRGHISLNLLTEKTDIVGSLPWGGRRPTMNDTDMDYLLWYMERTYGLTNDKLIGKAVRIIADAHRYHPIQRRLNSLEWDGKERIRYALHHFLGSEVSDYNCEALKLFMMGAIKRVFEPGCKFENMLCLVGGQGAGKSTFFRFMAIKDEWFSDDLRNLDDENIYRKLQGHWIIEMSEMIATANAKSIEEIKSFLSRQKETYKVPYEVYPADRPRQCVFGGTTNRQDFLPRDRTGNRRFIPVNVYPELAEVHILADEKASRAYMTIYRSGDYKLTFSAELDRELREQQQDFMQEDTLAGQIYAYLEDFTGDRVCSKMLYAEALGKLNQPQSWETREICEIMNTGIASGAIRGWQAFKNPKRFTGYGLQRGWGRIETRTSVYKPVYNDTDSFTELPLSDMDLPFE